MEEGFYFKLMNYLKSHAFALNKHESEECLKNPNKRDIELHNVFITNIPLSNCIEGNGYFLCYSPRFINTIQLYEKLFKNNTKDFNVESSQNILSILYEYSNYCSSGKGRTLEDYVQYLRTEACCYVVRYYNNQFGEILRVDLFRQEDVVKDQNDINKKEFTGGFFHCLKHYSINGFVLYNIRGSRDISIYGINNIYEILIFICICFSNYEKIKDKKRVLTLNEKEILLGAFYQEEDSNVFFVDSCYVRKR